MKTSPEKQRMIVSGVMLLWCAALIAYRVHIAYDALTLWLSWNLFLAVLPALFSLGFQAASARRQNIAACACFVLWLLFLPNAPYLLTDLIHLDHHPDIPLWYNLVLLLSCGGTGALLGYLSLIGIHNVVDRQFGRTAGWAVASGALILSGFGVYLGRFLRLNSWYAFTRPGSLVKSIVEVFLNPGSHPPPIPVSLVFGVGLIVGYLAVRAAAVPARSDQDAAAIPVAQEVLTP